MWTFVKYTLEEIDNLGRHVTRVFLTSDDGEQCIFLYFNHEPTSEEVREESHKLVECLNNRILSEIIIEEEPTEE